MDFLRRLFGKKQTNETNTQAAAPPPPPPPEPEPLQINELTVAALQAMRQNGRPVTVVDLRLAWEYSSGHIPEAINIPMMELPLKLDEIPKDRPVIMQCYHGFSSLDAAGYLIENGWDAAQVFSLSSGMSGWVANHGVESLEKDD